MEFRLGTEQRVCGSGDVVVIPEGSEYEAWFREDTEVIDFASARRLPSRRQTRLHERGLNPFSNQGHDCGAAEIQRIAQNAPRWPDMNT